MVVRTLSGGELGILFRESLICLSFWFWNNGSQNFLVRVCETLVLRFGQGVDTEEVAISCMCT